MKRTRNKAQTLYFDIMVNGENLSVQATPFLVNGEETRFRISLNEGPVYIFGCDNHMNRLSNMDRTQIIPAGVENAIVSQLENRKAA